MQQYWLIGKGFLSESISEKGMKSEQIANNNSNLKITFRVNWIFVSCQLMGFIDFTNTICMIKQYLTLYQT